MFDLATGYFPRTDAVSSFFISWTVLEETSYGFGKDVFPFQKGQIIDQHQAKKSTKETADSTKTGLRLTDY